jgi:transcriptional regulator NrdR family protein
MVCTYCSGKTAVTNSRHQKRANNVWRRRLCLDCSAIFSTLEQVDYEKTWVVQYSDGLKKPFLRDKLFVSIFKSCQHLPDPLTTSLGLSSTIIHALVRDIQNCAIEHTTIARHILTTLQRFNKPAAVHYQAFHADVLK